MIPQRSGKTDDFAGRIMAMFGDGKPRTSEDVATRLQIPVNAAGRFLAQLYMDGRIRKAEVKHGYQIWEMAKWDKDAPAPVPGQPLPPPPET